MKNNDDKHEEVRIHINRNPYLSPNPTTAVALYDLGRIPEHQELFREVSGNLEDQPIPRNRDAVRLKPDEHFYSEREYKIIVNARKKEVTQKVLSFDEVARLAFAQPPFGANTLYTITYRNGPAKNKEGTLVEGQTVTIKDEMIFNVTPTDKS
jgi:Multiubiquitin